MTDFITGVPTTTVRNQVLRESMAWIAVHYDGVDAPAAWHRAVREPLGLPLDGPLLSESFRATTYDHVLLAFEEILALGLHYENTGDPATAEARAAHDTWRAFMAGIGEVELSSDERVLDHLDAMVGGLENWLTYTPGGLADATNNLDAFLNAAPRI
jgi:hypothetical protein